MGWEYMMINHVSNPQCFVAGEELSSSLSCEGESTDDGQAYLLTQSNRRIPSLNDRKCISPIFH